MPVFEDTLRINVFAHNLTEDMSTLSSHNDEVLMLLYMFSDTTSLSKPIVSEFFVLDSAQREKQITRPIEMGNVRMLFILMELDTDRSPDQVEHIFRKSYAQILNLFTKKDLIALQKIIGDDDLIGFKVIENSAPGSKQNFSFQGRYKLDKFSYRIIIER